jgi:hypothetical protein
VVFLANILFEEHITPPWGTSYPKRSEWWAG